jgi:N-acetyl-anhydromuramyl-L-alanine amidase AmpD
VRLVSLDSITVPVPTTDHGAERTATTLFVWHCTGDRANISARAVARYLADPDEPNGYHWLIDRPGDIIGSTHRRFRAWHAGLSAYPVPPGGVPPKASVNSRSLGCAFVNTDRARTDALYEPVTAAQIATAMELARLVGAAYPSLRRLEAHVRHRDVAPGRKVDPRPEVLDWPAFQRQLQVALA